MTAVLWIVCHNFLPMRCFIISFIDLTISIDNHWEEFFYKNLEDPEYRPSEKARITWKFSGVRGTKEKPNRAHIMRSPTAYVDGFYWTIKFFPRGNSVNSLSVYIECSPTPPKPDAVIPPTEFRVFKGSPDSVLDSSPPEVDIKLAAAGEMHKRKSRTASTDEDEENNKIQSDQTSGETTTESNNEQDEKEAAEGPGPRDWRKSAQIGVIMYNPNEPRTSFIQTSCHQFNQHNPDWGWTNFHGPWADIHQRQYGQREALLRNDTLAFDAYIRTFEDDTQSLWWHSSESEQVWDSLTLTGYRPMGENPINNRHEMAGLVSWLLLAPFRDLIQSADVLEHLTKPGVRPRPLCDALQNLLWDIRTQSHDVLCIDTGEVTRTLQNLRESSSSPVEFWERIRRTILLELAGTDACQKLFNIFDGERISSSEPPQSKIPSVNYLPEEPIPIIRVPVENAKNVQSTVLDNLKGKQGSWSLPKVLHVELLRQRFDKSSRQWIMDDKPVELNEDLDLSGVVANGLEGKYTLYGFVVQKGKRASGQFCSVLRPGGPNSRWLAFEDTKIESLTKRAALKDYEGRGSGSAKNSYVAVIVMYVRNDVVSQYLTGKIEPWDPPTITVNHLEYDNVDHGVDEEEQAAKSVDVEVYSLDDPSLVDSSLFDSYHLMDVCRKAGQVHYLSLPGKTKFAELRKELASLISKPGSEVNPQSIRLWNIGGRKSCYPPTLLLSRVDPLGNSLSPCRLNHLRLWLYVVPEAEAKYFSLPDPKPRRAKPAEKPEENNSPNEQEQNDSNPPQNTDEANSAGGDGTVNVPMDASGEQTSNLATDSEGTGNLSAPTEQSQHSDVQSAVDNEQTQPSSDADTGAVGNDERQANGDVSMSDAGAPATTNVSETQDPQSVHANNNTESESTATNLDGAENGALVDGSAVNGTEPNVSTESADTPGSRRSPEESNYRTSLFGEQSNGQVSTSDTTDPGESTQEDIVMQDSQNEGATAQQQSDSQVDHSTDSNNDSSLDSELIPLKHQVYFFVQYFDALKQEFRFLGTFFARTTDTVKSAIRKAFQWPDDKQFLVWQRLDDGISIRGIFGTDIFHDLVQSRNSDCFIVGDVLDKDEYVPYVSCSFFCFPSLRVFFSWLTSFLIDAGVPNSQKLAHSRLRKD